MFVTLFSTTTCQDSGPRVTKNTGTNDQRIGVPSANNENFQWATSTCVTMRQEQSLASSSQTTVSVTTPEVMYILIPLFFFFFVYVMSFWIKLLRK